MEDGSSEAAEPIPEASDAPVENAEPEAGAEEAEASQVAEPPEAAPPDEAMEDVLGQPRDSAGVLDDGTASGVDRGQDDPEGTADAEPAETEDHPPDADDEYPAGGEAGPAGGEQLEEPPEEPPPDEEGGIRGPRAGEISNGEAGPESSPVGDEDPDTGREARGESQLERPPDQWREKDETHAEEASDRGRGAEPLDAGAEEVAERTADS